MMWETCEPRLAWEGKENVGNRRYRGDMRGMEDKGKMRDVGETGEMG